MSQKYARNCCVCFKATTNDEFEVLSNLVTYDGCYAFMAKFVYDPIDFSGIKKISKKLKCLTNLFLCFFFHLSIEILKTHHLDSNRLILRKTKFYRLEFRKRPFDTHIEEMKKKKNAQTTFVVLMNELNEKSRVHEDDEKKKINSKVSLFTSHVKIDIPYNFQKLKFHYSLKIEWVSWFDNNFHCKNLISQQLYSSSTPNPSSPFSMKWINLKIRLSFVYFEMYFSLSRFHSALLALFPIKVLFYRVAVYTSKTEQIYLRMLIQKYIYLMHYVSSNLKFYDKLHMRNSMEFLKEKKNKVITLHIRCVCVCVDVNICTFWINFQQKTSLKW